jgi:peptide/nickel transport system substrate-binding protein
VLTQRSLAAILAITTVLLAACGSPGTNVPAGSSSDGVAISNETLRIAAYGGLPNTMSPYESQGRFRGTLENMYEPLVNAYRDTFEIRGVLAETWTSSADGTTYRFNLRKGVTFHDGTAFNAESVKGSYELMRKIGKSEVEPLLRNIKEVRIVDPNTIEFVIDPSGFPFIHRMTGLSITSAKAINEHSADLTWWANNAVGTGPYKLDTFTPKDRMVLSRNEAWWGKKPYFAKATWIEVPEPSTQALMIQKGDADIAYNIPSTSLTSFRGDPALKVLEVAGDRVLNVRMNINRAPLSNKALRQALAYATDYAAILAALQFQVAPPTGPVPSQYLGGWTPAGLITKQDLDKAKSLLGQAGFKPGELTLDVTMSKTDPKQTTVGEILQSSFAKIGVNVKLTQVDFTQTYTKLLRFAADPKANVSASDGLDVVNLVRGPFVPHPYAYFSSYEKGQPYNFYGYENTSANALFAQGYKAVKTEDAINFYKQGVDLIVAEQPDIWAYVEKRVVVLRSGLEGYYMHPTWFPETHVWEISRKK